MKAIAITQARIRLEKAKAAGAVVSVNFDKATIESAWADFLIAAAGIYSKLEQGAKGNGKSEGWFGRRRHERKQDPLLSYLHHARNAEEHGLDASGVGHGIDLIDHNKNTKIDRDCDGRITNITMTVGSEISLQVVPPGLRLYTVKDTRYGDQFDPPQTHLGRPIQQPLADHAVALALAYLEEMIGDAETYVV